MSVCTVIMLVISVISPPSCLASINELGAVGSRANKSRMEIIISFSPKIFPKIKINLTNMKTKK